MMPDMPAEPSLQVSRIVWGAMLAAVASYAIVLAVVAPGGTAVAEAATVGMLRRTFIAVGLVETVAVWLLHRRVAGASPRSLTLPIVCWALGESIAIYGLVLGLVARNASEGIAFFVWSVVVLLLTRPRG